MDPIVEKFIKATDFTFIPNKNIKVHIFKVKPTDDAVMNLIETGYFDGNESIIRETTTKNRFGEWGEHVYTIIYKDGSVWSWSMGTSGFTVVDEKTHFQRKIITCTINTILY
jgi:hypothetical protein